MEADDTWKRFAEGDPVHVRAQQVWMILVFCAANEQLITYGKLASLMGFSKKTKAARGTVKPLAIVAWFCQKHELPQLNSIVVNAADGEPGEGVVLSKKGGAGADQRKVMKFNWFLLRVPSPGTFRAVWEEFA